MKTKPPPQTQTKLSSILPIGGLVIGLVLIVLSGLFYWRSSQKPSSSDAMNLPTTQQEQNSSSEVQGLLQDILKLGIDFSCSFETIDPAAGTTTGKIFIADKANSLRGTINVTSSEGETQISHFIRANDTGYFWIDGETQGLMFPISPEEDLFSNTAGVTEGSDPSSANPGTPDFSDLQEANYSCMPWIRNEQQFIPPTEVEFSDMSSLLQSAFSQSNLNSDTNIQGNLNPTNGAENTEQAPAFQADCSICDAVPDEAGKAQCRVTVGCE